MPSEQNKKSKANKILPIIYVLDASGSMEGARIAAVNSAMHETVEVLKEVAAENSNAELKIGVLQFSSGAKWITEKGLIFIDDYYWNDLIAGGLTDFGCALDELYNKLSREVFLSDEAGYFKPVIIFMSDGEPTDDYRSALERVNRTNKWYKVSTKIAIGVGDDADTDVLKEIAGNSEAVIKVTDLETLKKLIRAVSVRATEIGTKSRLEEDNTGAIKNAVDEDLSDKGQYEIVENKEVIPQEVEDPFFVEDIDNLVNNPNEWEVVE